MSVALLSLDDVAARLHKSRRWLLDFLRDRPIGRMAGRKRLFTESDVSLIVQQMVARPRGVSQFVKDAAQRLPVPRGAPTGYIYLVRSGDLIKIGYSREWKRRVRELQTASPFEIEFIGITPGTRDDERKFHEQFAAFRSKGEWFRFEGELKAWIEAGLP